MEDYLASRGDEGLVKRWTGRKNICNIETVSNPGYIYVWWTSTNDGLVKVWTLLNNPTHSCTLLHTPASPWAFPSCVLQVLHIACIACITCKLQIIGALQLLQEGWCITSFLSEVHCRLSICLRNENQLHQREKNCLGNFYYFLIQSYKKMDDSLDKTKTHLLILINSLNYNLINKLWKYGFYNSTLNLIYIGLL